MSGSMKIVVIAATAALSVLPLVLPQAANAQVDVHIGPQQAQQPPRGGAWGDRDRDGIPNAYDRHDNRQQAWDKDRDGVPNRYDRFDNRQLQDRDHDGVPRAFDRNDRNPYR